MESAPDAAAAGRVPDDVAAHRVPDDVAHHVPEDAARHGPDVAAHRVPLDDSPSFLLSQLGGYAAQRFAERLQPLGVHPRHFGLLVNMASVEGQSQQFLAAAMGVHRNAMVGLVDELEQRGLVERRRHPTDRRAHALYLTPAARELLLEAQSLAHENDAELATALNQSERELLVSLLQRIASERGLHRGVHPGLQSSHPDK